MDFRNADLLKFSLLPLRRLTLIGMQWITFTLFIQAVHNLSSTIEHLELHNCIHIEFHKENLQTLFFSGVIFSKLKSLIIESNTKSALLLQFLDFWTQTNYEVFPVLDSLSIQNCDTLDDFVFDVNIQRTSITSLTKLTTHSKCFFQIVNTFLPWLQNCNSIGTLTYIYKLPNQIQHLQIETYSTFYEHCKVQYPNVQTLAFLDYYDSPKYNKLLLTFPNLQSIHFNNVAYPINALQQVTSMVDKNQFTISADCLQVVSLLSKQIQQYQQSHRLNTNLDEQITTLLTNFQVNKTFIQQIDQNYVFCNDKPIGAIQVSSSTFTFDSSFPIILFQKEGVTKWCCAMMQLSNQLYCNNSFKNATEIMSNLAPMQPQQPKIPSGCVLIPNPWNLLRMFQILMTKI